VSVPPPPPSSVPPPPPPAPLYPPAAPAPPPPAWGYGYPVQPTVRPANGKAIGALICGLISVFVPVLFSIPALILGYGARSEFRRSPGPQRGAGSATAGIVLGWLTLVAGGALIVAGVLSDDHESERAEDVIIAVAPVCRGQTVAEAGPYRGNGPFHAVIAGDRGRQIAWSTRDAPWRAETVADTELVACVAQQYDLIQTCPYIGGSDIDRYGTTVRVRVLAARSGRQVESFELTAQPRACRYSEPMSLTRLEGEVPFRQVSRQLGEIARRPAGGAGS